MATALFDGENEARARAYAELTWLNPFEGERFKAEDRLLGERAKAVTDEARLEALLAGLTDVLQAAREPYAKGRGKRADKLVYQDMVFFRLFHDFVPDFDRVISQAHERGHAGQRMGFYDKFQAAVAHWLPGGLTGDYEGIGLDRLFAVFFQVRRAYYHIRHYLVGDSPAANRLRARIWQSVFTRDMDRYQRVLAGRMGDIITLITGPSGTGKELVARGIGLSRYIPFDANTREFKEDFIKAFYPINLSALSPMLIESELFGHRKGAFTGALQNREGYFETCGPHGTVFLDEIGETDPGIQVKLLRVLQTRSFTPIGETEPRRFAGKIMAATNRDLVAEIQAGRFREDFYFRLNADRVETPPLREMLNGSRGELEQLVGHIASRLAGDDEGPKITAEVCEWINRKLPADYAWPGNFRELEQCVRNLTVHGDYRPEDLFRAGQGDDGLLSGWREGSFTAEQLLARYVAAQYALTPNYEELGRRLGLDRRTVKKYLLLAEH